jgi:hypothetical protein
MQVLHRVRGRRLVGILGAVTVVAAFTYAGMTSSYAVQFCNTTPIIGPATVGAAAPYPSPINVSGLVGTITDVNVSLLGFTTGGDEGNQHWAEDTDTLVSSPNLANVILMSDAGGDNNVSKGPVTGANLTFDDQAANQLPADAGPLVTGTYRPVNDNDDDSDGGDTWPAPAPTTISGSTSLTTFNGADPNGAWNLWVTDDFAQAANQYAGGWCIDILTTGGASSTTSSSTSSTTSTSTSSTTSTSTTSTTTTTTTTTAPPPRDCAVQSILFEEPWVVSNESQVRVLGKNPGTTSARCRTTLSARRVSPSNGPNASDYPERVVVSAPPGTFFNAFFQVTPPRAGTYRVTACVRAVSASGRVIDSVRSNDCKSTLHATT